MKVSNRYCHHFASVLWNKTIHLRPVSSFYLLGLWLADSTSGGPESSFKSHDDLNKEYFFQSSVTRVSLLCGALSLTKVALLVYHSMFGLAKLIWWVLCQRLPISAMLITTKCKFTDQLVLCRAHLIVQIDSNYFSYRSVSHRFIVAKKSMDEDKSGFEWRETGNTPMSRPFAMVGLYHYLTMKGFGRYAKSSDLAWIWLKTTNSLPCFTYWTRWHNLSILHAKLFIVFTWCVFCVCFQSLLSEMCSIKFWWIYNNAAFSICIYTDCSGESRACV